MNNQDYIRNAADLADGWGFNNLQKQDYIWTPQGKFFAERLPQEMKDALAAQLVRQVDDIPKTDLISRWCGVDLNIIYENDTEAFFHCSDHCRTMNTLKTIVDSGVLK